MKARLIGWREVAPDVRHFTFEADVDRLDFTPGQFVSLAETIGGKRITRAYSIASPPNGKQFEISLNLVADGMFSPHLFAMKPGDEVESSAPLGYFVMRQPRREAVFVATGTGITPFRSMLMAHLPQDDPHPITLLFGIRYAEGIFYREEFDQLTIRYPHFRFWPTLSRPGEGWQGRSGYVQSHLESALGDRRDLDVYICGMKVMVDDVRARLKAMGFDRKQIIYEKYD